jgi:hypothetical protein
LPDEVQVENVAFEDDGQHVVLDIGISNSATRTMHLYASPRKIEYDPASRNLTVTLSDENTAELPGGTFVHPRFTSVDGGGSTVIRVMLPRVITRLVQATDLPSAQTEALAIHEATTVEVAVAWSDTPYYPDPRPAEYSARAQLARWQLGVARGRSEPGNGGPGLVAVSPSATPRGWCAASR